MRRERLFRILGLLDQDLIEEAESASSPAAVQRRRPWKSVLAAAACVTVLCLGGLAWLITGGFRGYGSAAPADTAGGGYTGVDNGTVFMSYAGPVFPLTALENTDSLTAERALAWDFTKNNEGAVWGADIRDVYALTNATDADRTVTLLYPFAGSFQDLNAIDASFTVDGVEVETELLAGAYAGGFSGIWQEDGLDDSTYNLRTPERWEDYQTLLADGSYLQNVLSPEIDLSQPVTVYEFLNSTGVSDEYPAATQSIAFHIDASQTQILTYGINGQEWDDGTGYRRYSFFVPDGQRRDWDRHLLVVIGADIGDYTLQGYEDGGCDAGEELDAVSSDLVRTETTLGVILNELAEAHWDWHWDGNADNPAAFSLELYRQSAAALFLQYGLGSDHPVDRYADDRLDDILDKAMYQKRVFWLSAEVTIPAGETLEAAASLWKAPSFDYACTGSDHSDLQGYDLVTTLGSNLIFTAQTFSIEHAENIEIAGQNLGLDPEQGVTTVPLDLSCEHYYLEIRPR